MCEPACRKEDCSPFDIGTVYKDIAGFSPADKYQLIDNAWKPDALFDSPKSLENEEKLRKFRQEWFVKHPWLAYSKYLDGAFCLPCVSFGMAECGRNASKLNLLFRALMTF